MRSARVALEQAESPRVAEPAALSPWSGNVLGTIMITRPNAGNLLSLYSNRFAE